MTLHLDLNPAQERELEALAQREGVSVQEYVIRRLLPAHASNYGKKPLVLEQYAKPHRAQQFSGVAPTNRTAEEVEAEINAARDEWTERENAWRETSATPAI